MTKNLYIISGCNGAWKTTASFNVLPEILDCREFLNADEIARGQSPFNSESVAIEAGKLMLQRIEDLLGRDETMIISALNRKLDEGLQLAHQSMLEEKALHNETVVVSNAEGKIEYISAREVLASF